ncbi:MAG: TonB-dependent receptor plug domain-containing protein [Sulfurovum sp.]|nr:TonB-dependent receptor plug domain-containing protein [Sulfurovum sp.]
MITKKHILLSLITIPLLLNAEVTLDTIDVNAQENNNSGSVDEVVFQKEGYMKAAPMQKQMTAKQALQIAGTNGDPIKALKTFAGVVSTNSDDASEIYIHGSKPRETKFTINHLPIGYLFHVGGMHSVIAPQMTGQIDAYLGGFDVTYGAMGAVVDITPKYPTGSGKGHVHLGMYDADFAYDAKLGEDTNLFISARRSYFDLIASKVMEELDSDSDDPRKKTTFTLFPQFYDAQMILSHQMGDNIFSLEMIAMNDKLKIQDSFNIEKDPIAVGKINVDVKSNTIGARWVNIGDDRTSTTLLYRLQTTNKSSFFDSDFYADEKFTEYGLYHETVWEKEEHTLSLGGQIKSINAPIKIRTTTPDTTDFGELTTLSDIVTLDKTFKAKEYILFAQDIWHVTDKDHFRYGLRAVKTDFQAFGSSIDPRIAYVHEFENDFTVSVALGRYSQRPTTFTVIEGFGNPKIDTAESSDHYTLSMQKTFSDTSSLVIEPFFKKFKNLAISDDLNKYEAVGKGEAYGLDITYKKNIGDITMMAAYSYVNAKRQLNTNTSKQYRFEGDIPHTLQLSANYKINEKWRVSSYAKYSSGAPYTPVVGTSTYTYEGKEHIRPIYGKPYSKRLDANYDLDIQVGYKTGNWEYALELMNINALFKKNTSGIKYNDKYEEDGGYEQIGFLPAFHMTYSF